MKKEDIIKFALFLYHPNVLHDSAIDTIPILLFLNQIETRWLNEISKWTNLSKENVLMKIFELDIEEKTIYQSI